MNEFKTLREDQKVLIQLRDMWKARAEQAEAKVQELEAENKKLENERMECFDCSNTGYQNFRGERVICACVSETDAGEDLCKERDDLKTKLEKADAENAKLKTIITKVDIELVTVAPPEDAIEEARSIISDWQREEMENTTTGGE